MNVNEEIGKALQFHQAGRFDEAETIYNQILQIHPNHPDALHYSGVMAHQRGQNDKAISLISRAIQLYPNIPIYYNNLAAVFKASDNLDRAAECYRQAIRLQPDYAEAYCNLGVIFKCQSKLEDALSAYRKAIALNPAYADSYKNMGAVFEEQNKLEDAVASYRRFLNFKPDDADIYFRIAFAYHRKAEYDEAVTHYQKAIALKPDYLEAYNNLGAALKDQGKHEDAIACYKKLFDIDPNYAKAYNNMGAVYQTKGMYEEAMSCYRKTLEFEPNYAEAYNNLGAAFKDLGKLDESERQLRKALELLPEYADAYNNLGVVLQMQDRLIEAVSCFEKAIQFKPEYVEPFHNQALAFQGLNKLDEAVASYQKALEVKPEYHDSFCRMFHQLQHLADWKEVERLRPRMDELTQKALEKDEKPPEVTFENISRHIDPEQNYLVAKASGKEIVRVMENSKIDFSYEANRAHKKIIIGYLSNDFCSHPVAYQTLNLFGLHDRSRFDIRCYSYGNDDGSHYRRKIEKDSDAFIDIRTFSVADAAKKIHEDQVDILVDLMGYTKGHRLGICALRPAPIQVTWLGFPGTTGADFFDYIIADKTIAPPEHAAFFGEKLVYMPNTYMINDYQRPLGDKEWKRAELGLPTDGVVFCSFNRPYKIEPVMFDVWIKILKQVPGSVLWLQRIHPTAEKNIRNEAQERGVNPDRLIFSDKVPSKDDHTARQPLADIALDTRIYNGHATTNDALWAGVPVITLAGGHFASLASASFLHAIGLPELITHSLEEYESLAVRLARNPGELIVLRQKLSKHRLTEPLFDTPRFVKNLEKAYEQMWTLFLNKELPQLIEVKESEVKKKSVPLIRYPASVREEILHACSLHQAGQIQQAEDIYNAILEQYPDQPDALHLLGVIYHQKGDYNNAIRLISQAIARVGNDWLYHNNLGAAYRHSYQFDLSLSCYRKAVELKPDFAEGYYNIGIVLNEQEKAEESVFYYEKAIEIRPDYDEAVCTLLHQLQLMCDWKKIDRLSVRAKEMLQHAASGKNINALMPFISVICEDQPALAFAIAKSWSDRVSAQISQIRRKAVKRGVRRNAGDKRIRIGYLSSDFRNHPVASQMINFFKQHNRAEFEIFCYSFGTNDGSHYRQRIEKDCDVFFDMQNTGYADAADRIIGDGIDILVDLMGHTNDNKLQIFALRPAPIQVTWLGFPGTTGASFFDYIITDKTVTPLEHEPFYSEKFAYLPHTYMVNDYQLGVSDKIWKRSDFGLPEHGFVFCSFNRSYKIEPMLFDVWMKLLRAVPGSVLWLRRVSDISEKNLKKTAEELGVSGTRLIFTDKLPTKEEHISRHQLADLALDTRIYNGHATTNDALWAGVPVITLEGSHFASRAAAGFLKAIGLPELITHSLEEYGHLALKLAQSPDQLQQIRQKLSKNRLTEPLFNTPRFVRYLENAYKEMQRLYLNGQKPAHIEVRDAPAPPDNAMIAEAVRHHQAGQFKEAEVIYRSLIETAPGHPNLPFYYSNLGAALQGQSEFEEAIACYRKALQLKPDMPEARSNLNAAIPAAMYNYVRKGFELKDQGNTDLAIAMFQKASELGPDNPEILNNIGVLFKIQNRIEEAMTSLQKALQIKPEFPEASFNMGLILKEQEGAEENALNCFQKAVDLKPDYIDAVFSLFQQYQDTCTWQNLNAVEFRTREITHEQLAKVVKTTDMPFNHLTHWDDPAINMAVAKSWAGEIKPHPLPLSYKERGWGRGQKLTIGYVSGDYRNHPVGQLISAMFGRHDRSRFKVIAYSLCGDDGSPYRKRVERDSDQFVEIGNLSDVQAADRICQDGVDILIDLMGYTRGDRMGIFALRPAPIQAIWLGYPGTGGANFFDYIIADKHVAPDEHAAFFTEKRIHLPHSYLLTDQDQPISDKSIRRANAGLPEHAFVFCSFNRPYKIEPVIFDVWMSVLRQVPQSVLWLKHINALAEKNLRQEAANRSVNPDRLIFAPKWFLKDEHLARLSLADLVLDTRLFNGHSTSADALWAGVPVITMKGNHFASRVCSGLLSAVGLPELITYNLKEYESLAIRLAQNSAELQKIRQKLAKHRLTQPLFDTDLFVRNLENTYQEMWKNLTPNPPAAVSSLDALLHQGFAYQQAGKLQEAEQCYRQILATQPNHAEALHLLGILAHGDKKYDEAIRLISRAIQISPDNPNYYTNLGTAFKLRNKFDEAIMSYRKAVSIKPDFPEAWYNMGNALKAKKRMDEAFSCYHRVIQLKPDYADAYNNMGTGLKDLGRLDEAVPYFQKAIEVKPDFIEVYYNLGCVLKDMGKIEEAIPCFQKVIQFKPHFTDAYDSLAHQYQHACDWDAYPALQRRIDELSRENLKKGLKAIENPFANISRHADPAYNLEVAKSWANDIKPHASPFSYQNRSDRQKLRIGYLSNDFRNHPVAHLIAGLFKVHDRKEFQIFCYSYGWNDGSVYRQSIQQDCDRFVDLFGLNDEDAARRIHEDGVDILVDLMGHTKSNRLEICALRPAPIQITYLGFPGTSGAKFFDYMISDRIVTPESHAQWYSEQLVFMPDCYQVNDHLQPISEKQIKRADVGLPENAFVFCSFNQPHKIEPVMFDVWMNILRQVPNSVLWLLWRSQITENNLKKEAKKRGIHPGRLIFTPKVPKDEHLARHKLADLALDTRIYNGHTTTSDALWAGVPVVAMTGTHFASRVSSSILNAVGLPLITRNLQEYETLVLRLVNNPNELNIIRQKLAKHRLTQPLFDTPRFARNLENAYRQIWEIFKSGQSPRQIRVEPAPNPPSPPLQKGGETAEQQAFYYNNLGTSLHAQRRVGEAIACFEKVIALKPDFYGVYNNLGLAYKDIGKYNESLDCFKKVIQIDPRYTKAYYNMGNLFQSRGMLNEAIQCYQKAVDIEPEYGKALVNLFHRLRYICAWKDLPAMSARLDQITNDSLAKGERPDETAFINITRVPNPQYNFVVAKAWSKESSQRMTGLASDFLFKPDRFVPKKLKIGYMSADFRDHPVSHLVSELFGAHDRREFEIFCYSYGEDDGRFYRQKIAQTCDHFVDMLQMSYVDAAKRIYEDGIDILVDLMGHTTNSRLEICVLRPAPIQMTWLGFAGTSGADFFDYIITDKVVSPPEHAPYYSEKLAYMPHCYMINNRLQAISDKAFHRADVGLPKDAFVFSSFNQVYKFEPVMFDVWMRLLKQVPNSVLWLPTRNEFAEKNLRMEAAARGVNPERLIFAPILPDKSEHLARMGLADLALDTRIYNGHATTSDALWAGIPVITLQGTHFASRAASSLLTAIGLPELITHSLEEYERLALRLATQRSELQNIRQRLEKNRYTEPLFDTPRFVEDLEMLYQRIWENFRNGQPPKQISVGDSNNAYDYLSMGLNFAKAGRSEDAMSAYRKALEYQPDFAEVLLSLFNQQRDICDWTDIDLLSKKLDAVMQAKSEKGQRITEMPISNIARTSDPACNFAVAKSYSEYISAAVSDSRLSFSYEHLKKSDGRITIGYCSGDFRYHAVGHQIAGLFRLHNRKDFNIICYSFGEDDGSEYRRQIAQDCDRFVDIRGLSNPEAAKRIHQDNVQILVDLTGYTLNGRPEISALRPAPIQVSYLGFPGTSGSDFFDYIITDKIISPPEHAPYYSEKFAYMPHCYQISNNEQNIGDMPYRRQDFGLPQDGFVFCSFNQPYKIEPVMFDIWMKLLRQIPNSCLWLWGERETVRKNLRSQALARGVNPERIVFAQGISPLENHLRRLRLADIALDTRIYNGGATTSQALWAGIPVITLRGSHYVSRMSSSLLTAIGLPELITHSLEEYERLALRLATQPTELQNIRQRLEKNRYTEPLFDTPRFVKDLEMLYQQIWKKYQT
jgi:predicted O-linked N-acetylglucosamine transferase (SPINDLY family)